MHNIRVLVKQHLLKNGTKRPLVDDRIETIWFQFDKWRLVLEKNSNEIFSLSQNAFETLYYSVILTASSGQILFYF